MKTLILFMALSVLAHVGVRADDIVIGVASTGEAASSEISDEASRAPYFLVFDGSGTLVEAVENRDVAARRAGPQTAQLLKERGVTHYVAVQFGRNLIRALDDAGIIRMERSGAAAEVVKELVKELKTEQ